MREAELEQDEGKKWKWHKHWSKEKWS